MVAVIFEDQLSPYFPPFLLDNLRKNIIGKPLSALPYNHYAEVAELVDALGSGSSGGFLIPVQVRASAPIISSQFFVDHTIGLRYSEIVIVL